MNQAATPSAVGLEVPDFSLPASGGGAFELHAHRGQSVLLFFYPRDNTPGCSTEAADFRDLHDAFAAIGVRIFGVSRDTLASHEKFSSKLNLPYPLLSDRDERVCRLFDVIRRKKLYGKLVLGVERSTFLIDADGRLAREWRGVKASGHAAAVLAELGGATGGQTP